MAGAYFFTARRVPILVRIKILIAILVIVANDYVNNLELFEGPLHRLGGYLKDGVNRHSRLLA